MVTNSSISDTLVWGECPASSLTVPILPKIMNANVTANAVTYAIRYSVLAQDETSFRKCWGAGEVQTYTC